MRKTIRLIPIALIFLFVGTHLNGQCEPDTAGCKDINEPGEICPAQLPTATVNEPYEEVITVIAPGEATIGEITIAIEYITIDSIVNLPEGLSYAANTDKFWADSAYCVSISGTPVTSGVYPLGIYLTPWVLLGESIIPGSQILNDTSVVLTVHSASGIDPNQALKFRVLSNFPNPFSEVTRIGFFTPFDDQIELVVYNIMGVRMHIEELEAPPGECFFEFDGRALQPGAYIYRVNNSKEVCTGKFIKARK